MGGCAFFVNGAEIALSDVGGDAPSGGNLILTCDSKERAGAARSAAKDSPVLK